MKTRGYKDIDWFLILWLPFSLEIKKSGNSPCFQLATYRLSCPSPPGHHFALVQDEALPLACLRFANVLVQCSPLKSAHIKKYKKTSYDNSGISLYTAFKFAQICMNMY